MARIVLVDDSKFICKALGRFLTSIGHEIVATGHDGIEGLALYKEHKPDLLILDITMPNRDGRDCLRDIMGAFAEAKVVMLSAVQDESIIDDCKESGARDFVIKPLKFTDDAYVENFKCKIASVLES